MSNELQTIIKQLTSKYGSFLTTPQLAEALHVSEVALKKQRERGVGIPYSKLSRFVRYTPLNIAKYILNNEVKVA